MSHKLMGQEYMLKGFSKRALTKLHHDQTQESYVYRFLDLTCNKTDHTQEQQQKFLPLSLKDRF